MIQQVIVLSIKYNSIMVAIQSLKDALPPAVVLLEDVSNADAWEDGFQSYLELVGANHLQYGNWSKVCDPPGESEIQKLLRKLQKLSQGVKNEASSSDDGAEKLSKGSGSAPELSEEKSDGDVGGQSGGVATYIGAQMEALGAAVAPTLDGGSLDLNSGMVYFMDPVTDKAENADQRQLRLLVWNRLKLVLSKHPHLAKQVVNRGDVAALLAAGRAVARARGPRVLLEAFRAVAQLKKTPGVPWPKFADEVARVRSVFSAERDSSMRVPDNLISAFVLAALDGDSRYHVTRSMLMAKRTRPSLTEVMMELTRTASELGGDRGAGGATSSTGSPGSGSLTGMAARVGGRKVCFQWRDTGKCRFGDKCRFVHALSGGCAECGGEHDVKDCPKKRISQLEAKVAKLTKARLSSSSLSSSSSASSSSSYSSSSFPSSSSSSSSLSTDGRDPELDSLIGGAQEE